MAIFDLQLVVVGFLYSGFSHDMAGYNERILKVILRHTLISLGLDDVRGPHRGYTRRSAEDGASQVRVFKRIDCLGLGSVCVCVCGWVCLVCVFIFREGILATLSYSEVLQPIRFRAKKLGYLKPHPG